MYIAEAPGDKTGTRRGYPPRTSWGRCPDEALVHHTHAPVHRGASLPATKRLGKTKKWPQPSCESKKKGCPAAERDRSRGPALNVTVPWTIAAQCLVAEATQAGTRRRRSVLVIREKPSHQYSSAEPRVSLRG